MGIRPQARTRSRILRRQTKQKVNDLVEGITREFRIGANFSFDIASEHQFNLKFSERYQHMMTECSSDYVSALDMRRITFGRPGDCSRPVNRLENTFKKIAADRRTLFVVTCGPEFELSSKGEKNWKWLRADPTTLYRNGIPLCNMLAAINNWAFLARTCVIIARKTGSQSMAP